MDETAVLIFFIFVLILIGGASYIYFGTNILKLIGSNCTPNTIQTDTNGLSYKLNSSKVCEVTSCNAGYTLTSGVCVADKSETGSGSITGPTGKPYANPILGTLPGFSCQPPRPYTLTTSNAQSFNINSKGTCAVGLCRNIPGYSISKNDPFMCLLSSDPNVIEGNYGGVEYTSGESTVKTDCSSAFEIIPGQSCIDDTGAGISFSWTNDTCKNRCSKYMVEIYSQNDTKTIYSYTLSNAIDKWEFIGISGLPAAFYNQQCTLSIMPYDNNNVAMLKTPVIKTLIKSDRALATSCKNSGIQFTKFDKWTLNKSSS